MHILIIVLLLVVVLPIYFLPAIAAHMRGHINAVPVTLANFFFGWTGAGWAISLIWAFTRSCPCCGGCCGSCGTASAPVVPASVSKCAADGNKCRRPILRCVLWIAGIAVGLVIILFVGAALVRPSAPVAGTDHASVTTGVPVPADQFFHAGGR